MKPLQIALFLFVQNIILISPFRIPPQILLKSLKYSMTLPSEDLELKNEPIFVVSDGHSISPFLKYVSNLLKKEISFTLGDYRTMQIFTATQYLQLAIGRQVCAVCYENDILISSFP
jgi:hypothetical protein